MDYFTQNYPQLPLSLDVSTDNPSAIGFYRKCGLMIKEVYVSEPDRIEFAAFESPIDKKGINGV